MSDGVYGNDGPHFAGNFVEEVCHHAEKFCVIDLTSRKRKKKCLY